MSPTRNPDASVRVLEGEIGLDDTTIAELIAGIGGGGSVDVTDRVGRLLGIISGAVDVTDRAARLLGVVSGPLTDAQLRASAVSVAGPLTDTQLRASAVQVKDDYQTGQILADQSGAGAVLTFTFASAVQLVVIHSVGTNLVSRADPFGGTPSASLGVRCDDGAPVYMPVATSEVKVFAPSGVVVTVYGMRRS